MQTLSIFIILLLNFISATAMDKKEKKEIVSENKLRAILNATATQVSTKQTVAVPKKLDLPYSDGII